MPWPRVRALAALLFVVPACVYDGAFLVQGTVRDASTTPPQPLSGVVVSTRNGPKGPRRLGPHDSAQTTDQGTYQTSYRYSGMQILFFSTGTGDPYVEFRAPGYESRLVQVSDHAASMDGVTTKKCGTKGKPPCFQVDVVLWPAHANEPAAVPDR